MLRSTRQVPLEVERMVCGMLLDMIAVNSTPYRCSFWWRVSFSPYSVRTNQCIHFELDGILPTIMLRHPVVGTCADSVDGLRLCACHGRWRQMTSNRLTSIVRLSYPNVGSDHQLDKKDTRFVTCVTAFLVNKVRSWFHNESSPEQVQ